VSAFTQAQTDFIKAAVEAVPGFVFVNSNPVDSPPKMFLSYKNPTGAQHNQNTPVGGRHDWLTDQAQFESVVTDAIDVMKKDV